MPASRTRDNHPGLDGSLANGPTANGHARPTGGSDESAAARYEVLERAAEGTLWVAYRVRDRASGRVLCLKALKGSFARHPAFTASLKARLNASLQWSHTRLVSTYEVGEEDGTPYFVSDWISGGTLETRLRRAPFGRSEALAMVRQIAEGLDYLHAQGTAHGDLRPRQVLWVGDGNLKLTDGGQAQAFGEASLNLCDIESDAAPYQAPERWDNRPPSPASDLYALGVILYRMLTGSLPFEGHSPLAIARKHREEAPIRPSQINARCPSDLERIALRLLEKDPQSRYVSAAHLLRDLSVAPPSSGPANPRQTAAGQSTLKAAAAAAPTIATQAAAVPPHSVPSHSVLPAFPAGNTPALTDDDEDKADLIGRKKHRKREALGAMLALFWTLIAAGLLSGIVYGAYYFWVQDLPREVTVPEYRYRHQLEAERVLMSRGLRMRVMREVFDPKKPTGTVLSGEKRPGETVRQGRSVGVVVSRGPEPIRMYDFSELTLQQARQVVMRDGLRLGQVAEQYHDRVPAGYICGQYPEPGESFRRSEPINLIVSRGAQPSSETTGPAQLPPLPEVTPALEEQPSFTNPAEVPDVTLVSRAVQVRVVIPANGNKQEVRVQVRDANGEETVYRRTHNPGELVDETIQVTRQQGTTALIRIYVGGSLLREERV
ncbi:MAG: eukaryotic-like serine/threonine-protein kinase [Abditibacteriota bacterium]|nr:eukaryotic-like serine/threonine-protein kinase [Abditibacteriota bacterium]